MAEATTPKIPAYEVFRQQFSAFFDNIDQEAPWLLSLYNASQKYYNQGMTDADIPDLLLTDENAPQAYKDRFAGIFKLKQRRANGYNVAYIPTVADYATMTKQVRREFQKYGLNDLGNDANIADIIGNDVDFEEVQKRLSDAFYSIDNADEYLKRELATNFPTIGRTDLAKALLTGETGAVELKKKIEIAGVRAAASEFGLSNKMDAEELLKMGVERGTARAGYERSAQELSGLTEASKKFGATMDIESELEQQNVLQRTSQGVTSLRSQARAEFKGSTGASSASLRRKRQV
jgi:hypothetical protein